MFKISRLYVFAKQRVLSVYRKIKPNTYIEDIFLRISETSGTIILVFLIIFLTVLYQSYNLCKRMDDMSECIIGHWMVNVVLEVMLLLGSF